MAKLSSGILGGISGTVGNVVGGSWRGVDYIRSKAASIKNPNTEAQQTQRTRFRLVISLLKKILPFIHIGFPKGVRKQSPYNRAVSLNIKQAVTGTLPDMKIDPAKLVVSQGVLPGGPGAAVDVSTAGTVTVTWQDNTGESGASADDGVMVLLYNQDKDSVVYRLNGAVRSDGTIAMAIPANWSGDTVAVYLSFRSALGRDVSDSQFLGSEAAA